MKRPGGLAHRFFQHGGNLRVPTIVLAELYAGARKLPSPDRLLVAISELTREVRILDFDRQCAEVFGRVRAGLMARGISVDVVDLMIAFVALVHDLTLVTQTTADFRHVPGLLLEDWLAT